LNKAINHVYSKVILCGEHSVLRGGKAIVIPLKDHSVQYTLELNGEPLAVEYDASVATFEILIEGTFEKALELLELKREDARVKISLKSLVPLGKGLGGSAAVCVFVAKVFESLNLLQDTTVFSFAVELENMFHGESSGVDVAGCLSDGPQVYVRGKVLRPIKSNVQGLVFGLSDCGTSGDTEESIEKVLRLKNQNKDFFYSLDSDMNEASGLLAEAIEKGEATKLVRSFQKSSNVFKSWGLVTESMAETADKLQQAGALMTKPTGSGLGGCILSVWREEDLMTAKIHCLNVFKI